MRHKIKTFGDILSRIDWTKVLIVGVLISLLMMFLMSCQEEPIKVPVGCECNDGLKLDFSKSILPGLFDDIKFEPKHCDGGEYSNGCYVLKMFPHGGFKRFIYDVSEL